MTLLISCLAAVITTLIWYTNARLRRMGLGTLVLMYWGASLMWLVDAVTEFMELRAEYFQPGVSEMLNDSFLGLSVVVLGLLIWLVMILIRDPEGTVSAALHKKNNE